MVRGFTLIELSIVLIIIGLLVGGVLAGRELIAQAEIRAQINQIKNLQTASSVFLLKYDGMPGDLDNGVAYGIQTTNGDGDGFIEGDFGTGNEAGNVLEALSGAGLVDGNYAEGELASMVMLNVAATVGSHEQFIPMRANYWIMGFTSGGQEAGVDGAAANALQTQSIDLKIDDGTPATGNMLLANWNDDIGDASSFADYFSGDEDGEGCADSDTFTAMASYDPTHADFDCTFIVSLYP